MEAAALFPHSPILLQVCHDPVEVVLLSDAKLVAQFGHGDAGVLTHDLERLVSARPARAAAAPPAPVAARRASGGGGTGRAAGTTTARLIHSCKRFLRLLELQVLLVKRSKFLKSIIYLLALLGEEVSHPTLRGEVCI